MREREIKLHTHSSVDLFKTKQLSVNHPSLHSPTLPALTVKMATFERISLQRGVAAYTQGHEILPLDLRTAIKELPSARHKELKKAAIKIKAQKQDTESPEDLINRVIFECSEYILT